MADFVWKLIEENGSIRESTSEREIRRKKEDMHLQEDTFEEKDDKTDEESEFDKLPELSDIMREAWVCHQMKNVFFDNGKRFDDNSKKKQELIIQYDNVLGEYVHYRKQMLKTMRSLQNEQDDNETEKYKLIAQILDTYANSSDTQFLQEDNKSTSIDRETDYLLERIKEKYIEGKSPYYWLEKLIKQIGGTAAKRRMIVRLMHKTEKYYSRGKKTRTVQLILDSNKYKEYIDKASSLYIDNTEKVVNDFAKISFNSITKFQEKIAKLKNCIESYKRSETDILAFEDYVEGTRCYALFSCGGSDYIALSGLFDFMEIEIREFFHFKNRTIEGFCELRRDVQTFLQTYYPNVVWARLTLNTKRYFHNNEEYIPDGESLRDTINKGIQNVGRDFSCCERKIFGEVEWGNDNKAFLFTKISPCPQCCGALVNMNDKDIQVFCLRENKIVEYTEQEIVLLLILGYLKQRTKNQICNCIRGENL